MIINRNFTNKKFFMNFSKTTFYRNASSAIVYETDKCIKINWSTLTNVIPNAYASIVTLYKVNDNMYANNATTYNYFKPNTESKEIGEYTNVDPDEEALF